MSQYGTEPAYGTEGSTVDTGVTGDGGGTTDQVKDQVREKAQVAQDKARGARREARSARPGAGSATKSTTARPRPASASPGPPRTCARSPRSCAARARTRRRPLPSRSPARPTGSATTSRARAGTGSCATSRTSPAASRCWSRPPGLALGFVASRFLKASSSRHHDQPVDHQPSTGHNRIPVHHPHRHGVATRPHSADHNYRQIVGPGQRIVPNVVGLHRQQAADVLAQAQLGTQMVPTQVNDSEQVQRVVAQQPSAGQVLPAGSEVTVLVDTRRPTA
jgi:PASTA domain-containing protein